MSTSEPNNSAPPSPDDSGVVGKVLSLASLLGSRCTLLVQTPLVSPGSQMQPEQPHMHASPPIVVCPARATEAKGGDELVLLVNAGSSTTSTMTVQRYTDNLENFILSPPQENLNVAHLARFYPAQALLRVLANVRNVEDQTRTLIRLAELAYGARNYNALRELSAALACLPSQPAQDAARYYAALCLRRAKQYDKAVTLLANLQQPRAVQTLATVYEAKGEWHEAARRYVEVMRRAKDADVFAFVCATMQLATIRAIDGDHAEALAEFQSLWPMVRVVAKTQSHVYPAWCNALAVELAAIGRVEDARAASAVAVASPIARAYPEWQETAEEIAAQRSTRTIVTVALPQTETDASEERPSLLIQHRLSSPVRLPLAPPSLTPARLLTCAPIHGPPLCI
ncbi:MAG: hypothetical protein V7641_1630 [Blastocatellia bacterium]